MSKLAKLKEKRKELRNELKQLNQKILAEVVNELIFEYGIDFKEQGENIPAYVALSFDGEYDDEGGTDTVIDTITFFDEQQHVVDTRFDVQKETTSTYRYSETFYEKVYEAIQNEFDLDELCLSVNENEKISLN